MAKGRPRVPEPAICELLGEEAAIQVNHCRMPACENFGLPARHEPQKPGPSPNRDMRYKVHSTNKGQSASIKCKSCGENPPLKSNASIVREAERLIEAGGLLSHEESASCPHADCENRGLSLARHRRSHYRREGPAPNGRGARWRCKACGRRFTVSDPVRLGDRNKRLAADLFSRIANKSPLRGAVRGSGLASPRSYYPILRFIHRRCRAHSGAVDRALIDGRLRLPADMRVETDAQEFTMNWTSRLDRRNVVLSSYCSVDAVSGFILGMHANFDGGADPFKVQAEAARCGDYQVPEPFRRHARYWLVGDDMGAGRALANKVSKHDRMDLLRQIERAYGAAQRRADVEDFELDHHDPGVRALPHLAHGMQVHLPYTAYAHWMLLRRTLKGAGVRRVQANMDIDAMSRAAFMSAFAEEVLNGDADAFFVRYTKFQTIDQRRAIVRQVARERASWKAGLPPEVQADRRAADRAAARLMMAERLREGGLHRGKWDDLWIAHPHPTLNEPDKAVCWMTPRAGVDEARKIDLHLDAGIARIDNVFMKARRMFSALERPIGASSSHNRVWHGYAPYNPAMLEAYLTLFRTASNFIYVGEDGRTPAMRLGFADEPLRYEDVLWPGERVPRPRAERRRGRTVRVPRRRAA